MRIIAAIIIAHATITAGMAAVPPVIGSFATGPDSAVYLYWFHPEINVYEQGIVESDEDAPIMAGTEPGDYYLVQRSSFPPFSCLIESQIKVFCGDNYPDQDGNQFSPFKFCLFRESGQSLPDASGMWVDTVSLCGGEVCAAEWAKIPIGRRCLTGEALWIGPGWLPETPSAPEFAARVHQLGTTFNRFGSEQGGNFSWQGITYAPLIRHDIIALMEVDTVMEIGWRRAIIFDQKPDSFETEFYGDFDGSGTRSVMALPDTLLIEVPQGIIDSVRIYACYAGKGRSESFSVGLDVEQVMPIKAGIRLLEHDEDLHEYRLELSLENLDAELLDLELAFDARRIRGGAARMELGGGECSGIELVLPDSFAATARLPLMIQDYSRAFYPYLLFLDYPPQGTTAAEGESDLPSLPSEYVLVYPNPVRDGAAIHFKTARPDGKIGIFNILGQKVQEFDLSGPAEILWGGGDRNGVRVSPGIYLVRWSAVSGHGVTRKMIILE